MKKVLLATTMLVAGASVAVAEVTVSGDGRMGLSNPFQFNPAALDPTGFTSRARVAFTLSGESESGLSFGASFRADNAAGAAAGTAGSVFIQGAFGKLSMGDVDGAANAAVGHVDDVGLTGLGDTNESVFIANSGFSNALIATNAAGDALALTGDPSALYQYTMGSVTIYASVSQPTFSFGAAGAATAIAGGALAGANAGVYQGDAYGLGVAYAVDGYKVSLGYERLDLSRLVPAAPARSLKGDHWILGGDATFGDFTAKARYGKADFSQNNAPALDFEQMSLSGTYKMDALSVTLFASDQQFTTPAGANVSETRAVGIGASYDLGGGASVVGGIVDQTRRAGAAAKQSDTAFDLGVSLKF